MKISTALEHGVNNGLTYTECVKAMKDAGFNAIRSSHYPMSRQLLAACDRIGMYVMDEFSDVWTGTKVSFDYAVNMADYWEYDIGIWSTRISITPA